ncbi:MAG: 4Fe-4S dicluster domain-containing protein [Promethearchaeota archaeon]
MSEEIPAEIKEELEEIARSCRLCYQCGTCAAGCPVFRVRNDKNPRLLVEQLLLDQTEAVINSDIIWYCCNCYTCSEHCPQGVDLTHVMMKLKNLSVKLGNIPNALIDEFSTILTQGLAITTSKTSRRRREQLGLPKKLPDPDVKEVSKLLNSTGLKTQIELVKNRNNK